MSKNYITKIIQKAIAQAKLCDSDKLIGYIHFEEYDNGKTRIHAKLSQLPPGTHAMHIHEFGNLTNGCESLGPHYNPFHKNHGGRTIIDDSGKEVINPNRHVGDLGNIEVLNDGTVNIDITDPMIKLSGDLSVMGRALVIHHDRDDLGLGGHKDSLTTGHAGSRLVHAIIART